MPFAALDGVRRGCRAIVSSAAGAIRPSERWLGRVVNARRADRWAGAAASRARAVSLSCASPPLAYARRRVGEPLDLWRARAQHVRQSVTRAAYGHLFGPGRRQVGAPVDAGPQGVGGHLANRSCRRART